MVSATGITCTAQWWMKFLNLVRAAAHGKTAQTNLRLLCALHFLATEPLGLRTIPHTQILIQDGSVALFRVSSVLNNWRDSTRFKSKKIEITYHDYYHPSAYHLLRDKRAEAKNKSDCCINIDVMTPQADNTWRKSPQSMSWMPPKGSRLQHPK